MYLETETNSNLSRMCLINVDPVLNIEEESETPTGTIALRYAILSHRCMGEEDLKNSPRTNLNTAPASSAPTKWLRAKI